MGPIIFTSSTSYNAEPQNVYWVFSAASQSVSAFVAFLVTGFAFVHTIMDSLQEKDDTLEEIHYELKLKYYLRIKWLSILTGTAIVLILTSVYINGLAFHSKHLLYIFTFMLDITVICWGLAFVVSIINPDKYKDIAMRLIEKEKKKFIPTGQQVAETYFLYEFSSLEKTVRSMMECPDMDVRTRVSGNVSFGKMVRALYRCDRIGTKMQNELLDINKFRNLIIHGNINTVDEGMVARVKKLNEDLILVK